MCNVTLVMHSLYTYCYYRQFSDDMEQLITQCRVAEIERDRLLGLGQLLQQRYN